MNISSCILGRKVFFTEESIVSTEEDEDINVIPGDTGTIVKLEQDSEMVREEGLGGYIYVKLDKDDKKTVVVLCKEIEPANGKDDTTYYWLREIILENGKYKVSKWEVYRENNKEIILWQPVEQRINAKRYKKFNKADINVEIFKTAKKCILAKGVI